MSNTVDRHERIALTNRYVEIVGRPAIPVSGELHYSRVPREEWEERLRLLRSGGITIVATYVFWNHHEVEPGGVSFDGRLDLAAFVRLCEGIGLDVVVRIGPWCHGEARNGGFPDRVQDAPVAHRTDDPAYLASSTNGSPRSAPSSRRSAARRATSSASRSRTSSTTSRVISRRSSGSHAGTA